MAEPSPLSSLLVTSSVSEISSGANGGVGGSNKTCGSKRGTSTGTMGTLSEDCLRAEIFFHPDSHAAFIEKVVGNSNDAKDWDIERCMDAFLNEQLSVVYAALASRLEKYLWNRDAFVLRKNLFAKTSASGDNKAGDMSPYEPHLWCEINIGDFTQDEWFVVSLLLELTKAYSHMCARLEDSDGQFMLIEAALVLPSWVTPENAANRVFLRNGLLQLIPPYESDSKPRQWKGDANNQCLSLSFEDALAAIWKETTAYVARPSVQRAIRTRLEARTVVTGHFDSVANKTAGTDPWLQNSRVETCILPAAVGNLFVEYPSLVGLAIDYLSIYANAKVPIGRVNVTTPSVGPHETQGLLEGEESLQPMFNFSNCPRCVNSGVKKQSSEAPTLCSACKPVIIGLRLTQHQLARLESHKMQVRAPSEFTFTRWRVPSEVEKGWVEPRALEGLARGEALAQSTFGARLCWGLSMAYGENSKWDGGAFFWTESLLQGIRELGGAESPRPKRHELFARRIVEFEETKKSCPTFCKVFDRAYRHGLMSPPALVTTKEQDMNGQRSQPVDVCVSESELAAEFMRHEESARLLDMARERKRKGKTAETYGENLTNEAKDEIASVRAMASSMKDMLDKVSSIDGIDIEGAVGRSRCLEGNKETGVDANGKEEVQRLMKSLNMNYREAVGMIANIERDAEELSEISESDEGSDDDSKQGDDYSDGEEEQFTSLLRQMDQQLREMEVSGDMEGAENCSTREIDKIRAGRHVRVPRDDAQSERSRRAVCVDDSSEMKKSSESKEKEDESGQFDAHVIENIMAAAKLEGTGAPGPATTIIRQLGVSPSTELT